jgi:dipeptidyl aminopeptidase/acylaminoacyl peptidase
MFGQGKITPVIILFLLLGVATWQIYNSPTSPVSRAVSKVMKRRAPTPTPLPFSQITIPALRARSYTSKLGEKTQYQQNATYTSYLTSYTSDGLKINGLLTIPTGTVPEGGWPAIVFVHGYVPPTTYETTAKYEEYVDSLASAGFVVFKIDLRGYGRSEGTPSGAYYSADYVVDTLNARAALEAADFVNKNRIGLWGHSMAGNILMRAVAARPQIPAVVIWAGAVYSYEDMQKYGINDNSYRPPVSITPRAFSRQKLYETVGSPSAKSPFWKVLSPTTYAKDIRGAIQIHHAEDDDVVNIGYSRDLADVLKAAGVQYDLETYPTGGHNIQGSSFSLAMQRTIAFFKQHLP